MTPDTPEHLGKGTTIRAFELVAQKSRRNGRSR